MSDDDKGRGDQTASEGEAAAASSDPDLAGAPSDANAALRESEDRFRTLVENMSDIVVELDSNGVVCWLSPSNKDVLGREPESLVGSNVLVIVHEDDVAELVAGLDKAYESMEAVDFSYRILHADGRWRWIEGAGRCFLTSEGHKHFVGVGRDVSDYKTLVARLERQHRADQQLKELSGRFLAASTSDLRDAICDVLEGTARLAGADCVYIRPFPVREESASASPPPFEPVAWQSPDLELPERELPEAFWRELARGRVLRFEEDRRLEAADVAIWAELSQAGVRSMIGIPLFSKHGPSGVLGLESHREGRHWSEQEMSLLGLIGEMFSTSLQRLAAEAALRESQGQLIHVQKMDAIGRLAGGIAHEFNNLLTIILGYCRFLSGSVDSAHQDDLGEISQAAERAADLTRQLLAFGRRAPSEARVIDLNHVVEDVRHMIDRLLGDEVQLEFGLSRWPRLVEADPRQLEQVLINLAVNARDAMPGGGDLSVRTFERTLGPEDCGRLGLATPGVYNVLEVADTGEGISEDVLEHIFEPFFTTKEVGAGTGLGLSLAYTAVRECEGAIAVDSRPGVGTTFAVLIPAAEPD
jgi:PAS domain S-box-containing protein